MLLPIKPLCERQFVRRDGTSLIYIQYCYSSEKRTLLNTEIAIPPNFWNKKKLCVTSNLPSSLGNFDQLNNELWRMVRIVEDIVSFALKNKIQNRGAFVKNIFHPDFNVNSLLSPDTSDAVEANETKKVNQDLYFQIDDYIKCKQQKVTKATLCVYSCMKEQLKAYEEYRKKKITFGSFDFEFYEGFVDFLTFDYVKRRRKTIIRGLKLNTIGKTIKQLRIFIKDRVRRKIIAPIDLHDFRIPEEESDAIYLTYEEIEKMHTANLSSYPYLTEYRDLFVLACLTGLRFSDFSILEPEDLRNDMLYKKQEKSDHWVVIPLRKEAKVIFSEQFKEKIPQLTNPEFNRHIKTIGKLAGLCKTIKFSYKRGNKNIEIIKPKYDWITSHTARRSFCTNEFLAGTPIKLIMNISGHKNEKDFYKYIRVTPEEAAQKIKELWLERNDMKTFDTDLKKVS
ncbi:site-specific integrase [Segetibacter koreensis]|uniref:site-specific integrase n=1 Tax=Segetibacter koreensis TaxID=398037 RepID=UPI0003717339|nr:site-specific integrase [Segetibacter koreensis]